MRNYETTQKNKTGINRLYVLSETLDENVYLK